MLEPDRDGVPREAWPAAMTAAEAARRARSVRQAMPATGLFQGQQWRLSPGPFPLSRSLARELDSFGRVWLQFYRAVNLLYRQSVAGRQPAWIAALLDQGKPRELIALQRAPAFKHELPRVIRPDLLLTAEGWAVTELDSVPGGIGLTGWLNQTYSRLGAAVQPIQPDSLPSGGTGQDLPGTTESAVVGGTHGMLQGFAGIFGDAPRVHIIVSREAATYRPEMEWLAAQLGPGFAVRESSFSDFAPGDAVYRFFELFDLANVPCWPQLAELAVSRQVRLTPPPRPLFEEKLLFALLWNRNLREFWRRELSEAFFKRLLEHVPYSWVVDPAPLPPQAAFPELNLTEWSQLKELSQQERELVLKISGFSELAWGARGVFLGSDLSRQAWSAAVDQALASYGRHPYVLQRYLKPRLVETATFDFQTEALLRWPGRARLCPYYFVSGDGDAARVTLGGVLATVCPADKKIVHGMSDAALAPCAVG
jgi:hypothetical protein